MQLLFNDSRISLSGVSICNKQSGLRKVPMEILAVIFGFLTREELCKYTVVSREWKIRLESDPLWSDFCGSLIEGGNPVSRKSKFLQMMTRYQEAEAATRRPPRWQCSYLVQMPA